MTETVQAAPPGPIITRPLAMMMTASVGGMTSFYLLLSVVPLYAAAAGGGGVGAGLATGAIMLSTVLMELAVPRLVAAFGYRAVMAAGLVLLGVPALGLLVTSSLPAVLIVCLARGAGLGIVVVVGTALTAELVPAARRAEGLGVYGVAVGVPSVAGLPLGLWISDAFGYGPVFAAGAVLPVLVLLAVVGLPSTRTPRTPGVPRTVRTGGTLWPRGLARPALIFSAVTLAAGVVVTFLPLAVPRESLHLATAALFAQSAATPIARWWAGRAGDRHGSSRLLLPGMAAAAAGMAALVWVSLPPVVIAGAALFGAGFGILQNVTLAMMFERVRRQDFGRVSALWNLAYDAGMGAGALGMGFLLAASGYPLGFALTAAVLVAALVPAWLDRRAHAGLHERARRAGEAAG
ncbi:MFS transporter [Streptosporangium sp. KLBMP 9127]|nr:MFS transporter [Streptosporangium sp. KLBMP 9127]